MVTDPDDPNLSYLPVERITDPDPSVRFTQVIRDRWWICHPVYGLVIFRKSSPQCNQSLVVATSMRDRVYPWATVTHFPLVLMPDDPYNYR